MNGVSPDVVHFLRRQLGPDYEACVGILQNREFFEHICKKLRPTYCYNCVISARIEGGVIDKAVAASAFLGIPLVDKTVKVCFHVLYPDCTIFIFSDNLLIVGLRAKLAGVMVIHRVLRILSEAHRKRGLNYRFYHTNVWVANTQMVVDFQRGWNIDKFITPLSLHYQPNQIMLAYTSIRVPIGEHAKIPPSGMVKVQKKRVLVNRGAVLSEATSAIKVTVGIHGRCVAMGLKSAVQAKVALYMIVCMVGRILYEDWKVAGPADRLLLSAEQGEHAQQTKKRKRPVEPVPVG